MAPGPVNDIYSPGLLNILGQSAPALTVALAGVCLLSSYKPTKPVATFRPFLARSFANTFYRARFQRALRLETSRHRAPQERWSEWAV